MKITDQLRKRLNDYQFDNKLNLKDFHLEFDKFYGVSYESLRQFWAGQSESTGNTLNALDEFLTKKGY